MVSGGQEKKPLTTFLKQTSNFYLCTSLVTFDLMRAARIIIPQNWHHGNLATCIILLYNRENIYRLFQEAYMRRVLSFFIGATIGGMIGATLALLFAPASGEDLRAQINDRAHTFAIDIRQAANTKRIELQERLEVLRAPKA
jgi:hypothetical protein